MRDRSRRGRSAIQLRCPSQTDRARHLRPDGGKLGCGLARRKEVLPAPAFVQDPGGEVAQHLASGRVGVADHIGVGVELSEVLRKVGQSDREHERLVAVIPRAPVSRAKRMGHPELGDLFSLARYPKGRVPDEDLSPGELARRPAAYREPVVGEDILGAEAELRVRGGDRDVGAGARLHQPSMLPVPRHYAASACSARSRNGSVAARNSSGRSNMTRWPHRSMTWALA